MHDHTKCRATGWILLAAALLCASGCVHDQGRREGEITRWGTIPEAMRDGRTQSRIVLSKAGITEHTYGVGAIEGLNGEITIDGGQVWVSKSETPQDVQTTCNTDLSNQHATLLFIADVREWERHPVNQAVAAMDLDAYLESLVTGDVNSLTEPVPFVIEGPVNELRAHVIRGECPIRASRMSIDMASPPFVFTSDHETGRIIGFLEPDASSLIAHHGLMTHMHLVFEREGETMTCHIENVGLTAGTNVFLPTRDALSKADLGD